MKILWKDNQRRLGWLAIFGYKVPEHALLCHTDRDRSFGDGFLARMSAKRPASSEDILLKQIFRIL